MANSSPHRCCGAVRRRRLEVVEKLLTSTIYAASKMALGAVKRAGYRRAMTLEPWAKAQAERLIAPLGDRWTHVQAVADKARRVAAVLPAEDADLLVV